MELPGGPVIKNLPSNAGDTDSISGWGTEILHQGDLVHATTRESSHAPRRTHTHTHTHTHKCWPKMQIQSSCKSITGYPSLKKTI